MEHQAEKSWTPKRDIVVAFRLTAMEAAHIDAAGAALKRPRRRNDFCRAAALYMARQRVPEPTEPARLAPRRLPARDTQLLSKLLAEVGRLGNRVHELADLVRQRDAAPDREALPNIAQDISAMRDAIASALRGGMEPETTP